MTNRVLAPYLIFSFFLFAAGCNNDTARAPVADHGGQSAQNRQTTRDEIALSSAQQTEGEIETQTAAQSDAPQMLRVAGRIVLADDRTARVGVRTMGLVMAVYAGLGDYVKKGQVLARYHADEVRDTRAQYRTAFAELNRTQSGALLAQRNYERAQTLLGLKAASVQQVEQARQDLMSAQTSVKAAQIEVDRTRDVLEDDLRVPADPPAGDESADLVPIIAPANGYIIEKNITPGKTVELSTDTFVIGDLSQVWMLASVRQEQFGELRTGQPVTVTLPGLPGRTFSGRITNLGQKFDPTTRVMQVRIVLNNSDKRLRPEMLANADIPVGKRKPVLLVPSDAIQQIAGQDIVFVRAATDRFTVRPVRVGETAGGKTLVLDGLKPGEQVVVRGSFVLKSQLLKSTMESE
jgi:cobalt-zinc-cadmium efflux system membrane fusion protein